MSNGDKNRIVNVTRLQNKVRAIAGLRGDNPVPEIADLNPSIVVEGDRPEWGFAGLENPFGTADVLSSAAVVGELSYSGLVNLPSTGMVAVVTSAQNLGATSVRLIAGFLDAAALAEFTPGLTILAGGRDSGFFPVGAGSAGQPRSNLRGTIGSTVGQAFGSIAHWLLLANTGVTTPDWFCVLRPGSWLIAQGGTANTVVNVEFLFRERPQERGLPS